MKCRELKHSSIAIYNMVGSRECKDYKIETNIEYAILYDIYDVSV